MAPDGAHLGHAACIKERLQGLHDRIVGEGEYAPMVPHEAIQLARLALPVLALMARHWLRTRTAKLP